MVCKFKNATCSCAAPSSLIAVVVDNSGEWPRGGPFRNMHVDIARQYKRAYSVRDLILGHCHISPTYACKKFSLFKSSHHYETAHTRVALLIAQSRRDAINMPKFDEALHRLALYLHENASITTVRVPRIGYGIPGITWYSVERTLRKHLCAVCEVHVFYYKPQCKRQATPTQVSFSYLLMRKITFNQTHLQASTFKRSRVEGDKDDESE